VPRRESEQKNGIFGSGRFTKKLQRNPTWRPDGRRYENPEEHSRELLHNEKHSYRC
jgi:hypothetical protein